MSSDYSSFKKSPSPSNESNIDSTNDSINNHANNSIGSPSSSDDAIDTQVTDLDQHNGNLIFPNEKPEESLAQLRSSLLDFQDLEEKIKGKPSPIGVLKPAIKFGQEKIAEAFKHTLNANQLVRDRSWFIDQILTLAWKHCQLDKNKNIALLAVGGYGRDELHPHSDIDVLLLLKDEPAFNANKDAMERFITLLWDLNLDIGSGVRTLKDCQVEAAKDITIMTNLLESRTIFGNLTLEQEMKSLTSTEHIWPSDMFFKSKWIEQQNRHEKYQTTEYNLEPNIKGSPGGLRDIQMITWMTKRHFQFEKLDELLKANFITPFELQAINEAKKFFYTIRFALHILANREEDRMLFNLQRDVAEMLGYEDGENLMAVETMMHHYYRYTQIMIEINELIIQHFNETILLPDPANTTSIDDDFEFRNGYLAHLDPDLFFNKPESIIKLFLILTDHEEAKGVHSQTIRALRDCRYLIDDDFRNNQTINDLFFALLRQPNRVTSELERMLRYGILGEYIPEFGKVVGQMEHGMFHVYTVDAHSVATLRIVRRMRHGYLKDIFPLGTKLIQDLSKKEIIYMAALLHDIGKGEPGDHSINGKVIAERFAKRHSLTKVSTDLLCWLVENHLLLADTAQKQDITDPQVLNEFAAQVGDIEYLKYLYVLTVADIYGTNPTLWNGWRAEQIRSLYLETRRLLDRGLSKPYNKQERIKETKQATIDILESYDLDAKTILKAWSNPGDEYFLQESPRDIAFHTINILKHGESNPEPLVLVNQTSELSYEGATQIFIFTKDKPKLFTRITTALDQLNLDIHDARIFTTDNGNALDTFTVLNSEGHALDLDDLTIERIKKQVIQAISQEDIPEIPTARRTSRQLREFNRPSKVTFSSDIDHRFSIIDVIAPDRPGLLACIGRVFSQFGLLIHNARLLTLGERVEDIFIVADSEDLPFSDPELCNRIETELKQAIDQHVSQFKGL